MKMILKQYCLESKDNYLETLTKLFSEIDRMIGKHLISLDNLLGIGVAVPGLIDKGKGMLEFAPNLGWKAVPIVRIFKDRYSLPIILNNEAKAAAIGERASFYPDINNMVFVSINEGIGCGIFLNGKLSGG